MPNCNSQGMNGVSVMLGQMDFLQRILGLEGSREIEVIAREAFEVQGTFFLKYKRDLSMKC